MMDYPMTSWLWLVPPVIGVAIWVFRDARRNDKDLGSVSAQWLHEYRRRRTRTGRLPARARRRWMTRPRS